MEHNVCFSSQDAINYGQLRHQFFRRAIRPALILSVMLLLVAGASAQTTSQPIIFDPPTFGPKIYLWRWGNAEEYSLGIQRNTAYFRFDKNFAWYRKGSHSDSELNPGANGVVDMVLREGKLGIGTATPRAALDVFRGNIYLSGGIMPMSLTGELAGDGITNLPLLNMSVNFRESDADPTSRGGAFRVDMRQGYPAFQWLTRSASGQDKMRMQLSAENGLKIFDPDIDGTTVLHVSGDMHVDGRVSDGNSFLRKSLFHIATQDQMVLVGDSAYIQYQASRINHNSHMQRNRYSLWVSKGIVSDNFAIAKAQTWADHVFSENYTLASLRDVEKFIQQNGRLPEMPSEEDVKANGYSVHDVIKNMLQKVEELTLYAIAQEKTIERLQQENEAYKSLMERVQKLEQELTK